MTIEETQQPGEGGIPPLLLMNEDELRELREHLDHVESRFDGVERRLDGIERRLDGVDTILQEFRIDVTRQNKEIYDVLLSLTKQNNASFGRLEELDRKFDLVGLRLASEQAYRRNLAEWYKCTFSIVQGDDIHTQRMKFDRFLCGDVE
ncbi:hypothetical protein AC1031_010685 [Aphanomyces cochlioides]|nr:hypothetical protein AC1031_010685 [Aphanomyces cochlioides]